jgi:hypothetical protein
MTEPFDPTVLDRAPRDDGGPASLMSLRDYFAGLALGVTIEVAADDVEAVARAYQYADLMIAQRNVGG